MERELVVGVIHVKQGRLVLPWNNVFTRSLSELTSSLMDRLDTICAPATAVGRSALAIVRVSGPQSRFVLETLSGSTAEPRKLTLRTLRDPHGQILDEALVTWFAGPASATGEDVSELHLHGGPSVVRAVLNALCEIDGVRLADPGEFTRRAVLNGKLDLTEAEAVADLIDAETDGQRRQALRQLSGGLGTAVSVLRDQTASALALVETGLDFSDEGDVQGDLLREALVLMLGVEADLKRLLDDGGIGERLRTGFTVVIAGAPNAGKSSLLNLLARRDASIVSDVPGTTRDVIEVRCDIHGLPVTLVDTAGVRESAEPIEQEGIRRALEQVRVADVVVWLTDPRASTGIIGDGRRAINVSTKCDLFQPLEGTLPISSRTGVGIDDLMDRVRHELMQLSGPSEALITRERHRVAMVAGRDAVVRAISGIEDGVLDELVAADLRNALYELGSITGHVRSDEILDRIFSSFCIGK